MSSLLRTRSRYALQAPRAGDGPSRRRQRRRGLAGLEVLEPRALLSVAAVPDSFGVLNDAPLHVPAPGVLANDSSSIGQALAVSAFTPPAHGTLALDANGSFTYTPAANYSGPDSFSYTASNGSTSGTATVNLSVVACTPEACVFAGPRLASVDSTEGPLLNAVLGGLLGTSLNVTAVDWTGLASASLSGTSLIQDLQTNLGLASPSQVLTTDITLTQLLTAAAQVAQADGNTAELTALNDLNAQVGSLTGTIRLGDLLQGELNQGNLANVNFNALDLVTGVVQLFNFNNVLTTPAPITISGAELGALGLPASVGSLNLFAQVVEPPIFTCGPVGTQFHTAAIRLKLDLNNLAGVNVDTSSLVDAIGNFLGISTNLVSVTANLNDLAVYIEVASASGTIDMIDAVNDAVTVQATPSLANVYIGSIADNVFFNRTRIIDPTTDLTFGTVGALNIAAPLINVSAGIQVRDVALGQAPASPTTLTFNPPYPAPAQTVGSSTTFITNLLDQLTSNLQVQLNGDLGVLNPLVNTLAGDLVQPLVSGVVTPIVAPVLRNVADPLLQTLGIGIGEAVVDVDSVDMICPPIANDDFPTTQENAPVTVAVLANDAIEPGDAVTVTTPTTPAHGTVVINPDGTITYTPDTGFFGTDTFAYTVTDGTGTPTTATVTVNVSALPPVATDDVYSTTEGTPLTVAAPGVLANDTSPTGQPLTPTVVVNPAHGTLTFNSDGSFTYVPDAGFVGADGFTYQDSDGTNTGNTATVTLTVNATPPPVANDDDYSVTQDTTLDVASPGVLTNDTSPTGRSLTPTVVTNPAHGALVFHADGSFRYVPDAGFTGTDSFTYHDSDGNNTSATATVTLNVSPAANQAPVANDDVFNTPEGMTLTVAAPGVQGNDTNSGGGTLASTAVAQPAHGTLTLNADGSFTYVPDSGFNGQDSFTYQDSSSAGTSNTATVTLNVTTLAAPTANDDTYSTAEGTTLTVAAPGILANDTNPGGGVLTPSVVTQPAHGTVALNADGSFTYVPAAGFVGPDSFSYRDTNAGGTGNTATVTLNVTATPPPVANDDAYSTPEGATLTIGEPGILANDTSPTGNALTPSVVANPAHGTLTFGSDGSFTYVPAAGFVGTDSFTYQDSDGNNTSGTATVTLNVTATAPPRANNDAYSTAQDTTLNVPAPGVLANDVSSTGEALTPAVLTNPAHGALTFNADGSFSYAPDAGFVGFDSFTYQDSDGNNPSNVGTVSLTVTAAANQNPVANNDAFSTPEGGTLTVPAPGVLANDTSPGGGALTPTLVANPAHGALTFNADGSFSYVPDAGFVGADSFTYQDSDGTNASSTATVTINVTPTAPPIANNDAFSTPEGGTLIVDAPGVLGNDSSPTGNTLTPTVVATPAHGTLTFNADGSFSYVPDAGFVGSDSFTYRDFDGNNTSDPATVTLNVTATPAPLANNDIFAATANATLTIAAPGVLANDVSPSGLPLTATVVSQPTHGTLTFHADGSFTYVPAAGFVGSDIFTYQDTDGNSTSGTATVTVNVSALPPSANDDTYSTTEGTTLTIAAPGVQSNDAASGGGALASSVVAQPAHGTLTLNADGSFTYVPAAGFVGADSFTYHDSNGNGPSNTARVTINVTPAAPLVANNDVFTTQEGGTLTIGAPGVLANDVGPAGRPLTAGVVTQPAHGTLTLNADGSFTYTPNAGFLGTDTFSYQVFDGLSTSNSAAVFINVTQAGPGVGGGMGPELTSIARLGFHSQPTEIVLRFSTALDAARAQNASNYLLQSARRRPRTFRIASAVYNAADNTVTLFPAGRPLALRATYRLTINGAPPTGLTGANGVFLDGNNGTGSNFVGQFNQSALVGPSPTSGAKPRRGGRAARQIRPARAAHPRLSPAAVDAVLSSGARLR